MTNEELNATICEIEKAADGSSLRNAIVNAIRLINESGGNAMKFNGYSSSYFAYRDDYEYAMRDIKNLLDDYAEQPVKSGTVESYKFMQSGNIFNYINALLWRINAINGINTDNPYSKTIAEALTRLSRLKGSIKDVLVNEKQATIEETDTFEEYGDRFKSVKIYNVETVDINENGTTTAPDNVVYNVINVDVQPKVVAKLITEDGTYEVPEGVDAWNPVTISVPGAKSAKQGGSSYTPSGSHSNAAADLDLATIDAKENGTYTASDQKKSAIGTINVSVNHMSIEDLRLKRFTVTFQNENGEVLEIQEDVVGGSSVVFGTKLREEGKNVTYPEKVTEDGTIWTFSYWDPAPTFVDHDMVCTAVFKEALYSALDSEYSWEDICNGVHPPVGTIKILNLLPFVGPVYNHVGGGTSWDEFDIVYFGPIRMRCVESSGGGTVWVSMDLIQDCTSANGTYDKPDGSKWGAYDSRNRAPGYRYSFLPMDGYYTSNECGKGYMIEDRSDPAYAAASKLGWANSPLRVWYNTEFYNQCIPPMIRDSIKGRNLTCYNGYTSNKKDTTVKDAIEKAKEGGYFTYIRDITGNKYDGNSRTYSITNQKIWFPSVREIWMAYSESGSGISNISEGSDNALIAVEKDGPMFNLSYSNYVEYSLGDWSNDRPKAIKDIFGNTGKYEILKHLNYYPFNESPNARNRPLGHNQGNIVKYYPWYTRSFYDGGALGLNAFGVSKSDMSKSEEIHLDSNPNIFRFTGYGNIGHSFAFMLN